ncbi:MAG: polyketide cyclase [Dehalococcoidia bacterium]|nr:polyketide cyclase [Dehalococcoidia bacterium]
MATVQDVITVAAPVERVWEALVDFEARPRWSPRVKEARILDGGPLKVGSRIRLHVDRDRFTPVVVELRPRERLALLVKGPGFHARHAYELRAAGEATTVTMSAQLGGLLGTLAQQFMRGSVRRDLADELAAIKRAAESVR